MPRKPLDPDQIARVVASLDDIKDLPLCTPDTPIDDFLAKELRQEILLSLRTRKLKMLFLLMEYGFHPREIAKTLAGLKVDTLQGYVYRVRHIARKVRISSYTTK